MGEAWSLHKYVIYEIEHEKYHYKWQLWFPGPTEKPQTSWGWARLEKDPDAHKVLVLLQPPHPGTEQRNWEEVQSWRTSLSKWDKTIRYAVETKDESIELRIVETNEPLRRISFLERLIDTLDEVSDE